MKCIGRNCVYNKCNFGNYCVLSYLVKEGDDCRIDEEIKLALEALNDEKNRYERLSAEKEKIISNQ